MSISNPEDAPHPRNLDAIINALPVEFTDIQRADRPLTLDELRAAGIDTDRPDMQATIATFGWPDASNFSDDVLVFEDENSFLAGWLAVHPDPARLGNFHAHFGLKRPLTPGVPTFCGLTDGLASFSYGNRPVLQRFAAVCPHLYLALHEAISSFALFEVSRGVAAQPDLLRGMHTAYRIMSRLVTRDDYRVWRAFMRANGYDSSIVDETEDVTSVRMYLRQ